VVLIAVRGGVERERSVVAEARGRGTDREGNAAASRY